MGRIIQPRGTKGSLKGIQEVVNNKPLLLDNPIKKSIGAGKTQKIEWLSPGGLRDDDEILTFDYIDRGNVLKQLNNLIQYQDYIGRIIQQNEFFYIYSFKTG